MANLLCFTIRYTEPYCHGRGEDGDEPEWPPSPLRLFQALVAASAARWNERTELKYSVPALCWVESLGHPQIRAAEGVASDSPTLFYVPDNTAELAVPAWKRGELTKAVKRTEKFVRPIHLSGDSVYYLFKLPENGCPHFDTVRAAARSITHLGWGIDMVTADASIISEADAAKLPGELWQLVLIGGTPLRVPVHGTLDALMKKHEAFLNRIGPDGFRPVPPLAVFRVVDYRRDKEPLSRPYAAFRFLDPETGERRSYPATRAVTVAGMMRGTAGKLPRDSRHNDAWFSEFVYGHHEGPDSFPRFSYLPLPSIQPVVGVGRISRVLIAEPRGSDGSEVKWLKRLLAGQLAKSEQEGHDALLAPLTKDRVLEQYVTSSKTWSTVTPVVLPGCDDGLASKTDKLIAKTLLHAGYSLDQLADLPEYHRVPFRRGAEDAIRYRPRGDHYLANCTMYHMRIRWRIPMGGPIALGAGRHCGLGVFAADDCG